MPIPLNAIPMSLKHNLSPSGGVIEGNLDNKDEEYHPDQNQGVDPFSVD